MKSNTTAHLLNAAVLVISRMGRAAAEGDVPQCLVKLSGHSDPRICRAVALAIPAIRTELPPPGTAAVIIQLLRDEDIKVRYNLVTAFRDLSELEGRPDFLDELAIMLQSPQNHGYAAAAKLASKLSPAAVRSDILDHLMRRRQVRGCHSYSWRAITALMKKGLRIFVEGSGPEGEVYRAKTVEELSRVDLPMQVDLKNWHLPSRSRSERDRGENWQRNWNDDDHRRRFRA